MICKSCELLLDESELEMVVDSVPYGEGYVDMPSGCVCPHCGSDELCEAVECSCCGRYIAKDTLDIDLCDDCADDLYEALKVF